MTDFLFAVSFIRNFKSPAKGLRFKKVGFKQDFCPMMCNMFLYHPAKHSSQDKYLARGHFPGPQITAGGPESGGVRALKRKSDYVILI